jgi:hypothetical protein
VRDDDSAQGPTDDPATSRERETRRRAQSRQLLTAIAIGALTTAATIGSILGQGISYRQMRAIESIAESIARNTRAVDAPAPERRCHR